jgi:xanthine dehydrogenase accessory factor
MAQAAGYAVTVVDPRRAWATAERFPGITLIHEWTDDAVAALAPDSRSAVVTLTHDPKLDDPALDAALKSDCFYIGALGSRRTHAKRVARLTDLGHGAEAIARIHAPVGLNIEAVTAPEIALSILAEVVAIRRGAALARRPALAA